MTFTRATLWKAIALAGLPSLYKRPDSVDTLRATHDQQVTDLDAEIGRLTAQVAWLKQTLVSTLLKTERAALVERDNTTMSGCPAGDCLDAYLAW